jgi:hypothetical protein
MEHRELIEELQYAAARFKIESDPAKRELYSLAVDRLLDAWNLDNAFEGNVTGAKDYDPQGDGFHHGKGTE